MPLRRLASGGEAAAQGMGSGCFPLAPLDASLSTRAHALADTHSRNTCSGNEVNVFNCSKDGTAKMAPRELAQQYAELAAVVRSLLPGTQIWGSDSSITGDYFGQCHDYYGNDLFGFNKDLFGQPGWAALLDAHTWHYYSQDSRNETSTAELILSEECEWPAARLP